MPLRHYVKYPRAQFNTRGPPKGYLMTIAQNATAITAPTAITLPYSLEFDMSRGAAGAVMNIARIVEAGPTSALNNLYDASIASHTTSGDYYPASASTYKLGDNTVADDITLITAYFNMYQIQPNWRSWVDAGYLPGMLVYDATAGITADDAIDLPSTWPKLAIKVAGMKDCIWGITRTKMSDFAGGGATPTYDNSTWGTAGSLGTGEYYVSDEDTIELGDNLEAEDVLFIHGWWDYRNLYPNYHNYLTKNIQPLVQVRRAAGIIAADANITLTDDINAYFDLKRGASDCIMDVVNMQVAGSTVMRNSTLGVDAALGTGEHCITSYNIFELGDATALHDIIFVHSWVDKWNLAY